MRARRVGAGLLSLTLCATAAGQPAAAPDAPFRVVYPMPGPPSDTACGAYCFVVCARWCGGRADVTTDRVLADLAPVGPRGVSAEQLVELAGRYDIPARAVRTTLPELVARDEPAVLHVNGNHYVAFVGSAGGRPVLFDSRFGVLECRPEAFEKGYDWAGLAVTFPDAGLAPRLLAWPAVLRVPAALLVGWCFLPGRRRPAARA